MSILEILEAHTVYHPGSIDRSLGNIDSWIGYTHYSDSVGRTYKIRSLQERFWSKVNRGSDEDCWEWKGALTKGYGSILAGDTTTLSHRVSWALANGNLPDELVVRHKCDNPPCVNPAHLELGTQTENVEDMISRNRATFQKSNCRNGHNRAIHSVIDHNGKRVCIECRKDREFARRSIAQTGGQILEDDVRNIRRRLALGERQVDLAKEYRVDPSTISQIKSRTTWKHVA